ncbi:coproporphyrinogen dehydrogenase HemZ [Lachnospiraceae bacterium KM106-2]|nr:coproporphyrinogen dehydrogenase HemZ [Lachnospiraceae bacterium KM106-2]
MIQIIRSKEEFEYELRALTMAFFPGEAITTKDVIEEEPEHLLKVDVTIGEREIKITFTKDGEEPHTERCEADLLHNRKEYKNHLKILMYQGYSKITGKELPWGTLTGIRPTKLALLSLEEKMTKEEIEEYFHKHYLCSKEKTDISLKIAKRELDILHQIDYRNGYSIYIGIPFCPTRCLYCSFTAYSLKKYEDIVDDYLTALCKEIDYAATCFPDKKLTTVYIGGGTPTTLNEVQLERLLKKIRETLDFTNVVEFTVEAGRPDSITMGKLQVLKQYGVTRISINPQTMNQKTLDVIGRRHSVEEVKDAFRMAREAGHDNINMDLIIGLPGEMVEDVDYTLEEIKKLNPDSLTVHTLAIKRAANLNIYKEKYADMEFGDTITMLEHTSAFANEEDYEPYYLYRQKNMAGNLENVGYARDGKEGIYNILIMEERQNILALGAGASSKFVFLDENRIERVENVKEVTEYITRVDEMIDRKERLMEKEYYGGKGHCKEQ